MVKRACNAIERGDKQAEISSEDLQTIENIIENNIDIEKQLQELPQDYSMQQAIKDGCVVISYNAIYNKSRLDSFITNTAANNENRKSDFIRLVQYTNEGDPIIIDIEFKKDYGYILTTDNTRDSFGANTKIAINDNLPEKYYTISLVEDDNSINIGLTLREEVDFASEDKDKYKSISVLYYPKDLTIYDTAPSFIGEVTEVNKNSLTVKSEDENNRDAIWVSVDDTSQYKVGDKIEVLYTGIILETYPCQIYEIDVKKIDE